MVDQVEEVKQASDVVQLVSEYVTLKKAGHNYKGICPFHGEKTPSFMVNPELGIYKCFGCGKGGDVISFLQEIEGLEFGEALQILADKAGIKLTRYQPTQTEIIKDNLIQINGWAAAAYHYLLTEHPLGQTARIYLESRKISLDAIKTFQLGFAVDAWDFLTKYLINKKKTKLEDLARVGLTVSGKNFDRFRNRVMFPLKNSRGQTLGFAGRVLPGGDLPAGRQVNEIAKYVNTSETEIYHKGDLLYGYDVTRAEIKAAGFAVVVEGELDAICSWQAGVKNVVAIKGSALTEKQVELLHRVCETVVLALDADKAGDAASRRGIEIADKIGLLVKVVQPSDKYKDPADWSTADAYGWSLAVKEAIPVYDFYLNSAVKRFGLEIEGIKKIGEEMIPILAKIEDEIVKGHYISKLAQVLKVREDDIRVQMGKNPKNTATVANKTIAQTSEKAALESFVVEMAIKGNKIGDLETLAVWFRDSFWQQVVAHLSTNPDLKSLPGELSSRVLELALNPGEFSPQLWDRTVQRLEAEAIRAQIQAGADPDQIRQQTRRLGELTKNS